MLMPWLVSLGVELIIDPLLTLVFLWALPKRAMHCGILVWDLVVERFHKRLAGWKAKLLSRGGGPTLLKSTLWSLPIYFISLFTISARIAN